ncbi:hypothetical protein LTR56_009875 [Elasticomyces elasticus]|nr:hypothetical protein LTR56_009875 [Elasticomyces elasticus]KAK3659191.1 hypothetical protein LTR22_008654 [Elasticomyces elasticus]KAK4923132.1 hypothetical protein LTR49_009600 [Elasticomyces elasticus]KAK5761517.1 hypothetical protein LTS12_008309 [Elasticomyces elasticus]
MSREETKLRNAPEDFGFAGNPFDPQNDSIGHFWGIHETRDYMRARYGVVEDLMKIRTREAVRATLDHLLDMLRLCRGDNMGVRSLVPALYIRLGRDQDAYDFVRWYKKVDEDGNYDWGDMDVPFLDTHDADVFEPVQECLSTYNLNHTVALTLIKIRLLLSFRTIDDAAAVGSFVPPEILDGIREQLASPAIAGNELIMHEVKTGKSMAPHISKLKGQVDELYDAVHKQNKYFWPALLSPGSNLTARPPYTSFGDPTEMQLALQYNYASWAETHGAIDVIRARVV